MGRSEVVVMPVSEATQLSQEWTILQNNFEQYEKSALLIKLTGIVLYTIGLILALEIVLISALIVILWLQESIFRTYQSRLGERILKVEHLLKQSTQMEGAAFQLHSEWFAARKGAAGLVGEYAANARRPTVAFPYAVLLLISLVVYWAV